MRPIALLLGLATAGLLCSPARADDTLEYAVKAAYLVKFAPFIQWPDDAFASASAPLSICVVGSDPFGAALDQAAAGQRDGDHPLTIRRMATLNPDASCQILFAGGPPQETGAALVALKERSVVTVTDSNPAVHGIISFVIVANHVRFDIDEAAADAAGIRISSKLLGLAHAVVRGARP